MIILIVDDEPSIVEIWKALLKPIGAAFRHADCIEDALVEMAKEPFPDLVILDLRLRTTTSEATLRHIEDFKVIYPGTVVLVVTGNPDQSLPTLAASLGADGFANKTQMAKQSKLLSAVKVAYLASSSSGSKPYERRIKLLELLKSLVDQTQTSNA